VLVAGLRSEPLELAERPLDIGLGDVQALTELRHTARGVELGLVAEGSGEQRQTLTQTAGAHLVRWRAVHRLDDPTIFGSMGLGVCTGAMMMCSFGMAPSTLNVLPQNRLMVSNRPMANILDNKPFANIPPFGMCMSLANPTVAAATAAALGVLTPMPCTPVTTAPWIPGSPTVMAGPAPALNNSSQCLCAYGGVITITMPGQVQAQVP
jgi:hypothetical protein